MGKNTGGNRKSGRADAGANADAGTKAKKDTKPPKSIGGLYFDENENVWRQQMNGKVVPDFKGEKIPLKSNYNNPKYAQVGHIHASASIAEVHGVYLNGGYGKGDLGLGISTPMRIVKSPINKLTPFYLVESDSGEIIARGRSRQSILNFAADMVFSVYE